MADKEFNALTASPAELAAEIKRLAAADRLGQLRVSDAQNMRNLGVSEADIKLAQASPEERAKVPLKDRPRPQAVMTREQVAEHLDNLAKTEAQRQFKIAHARFLDEQRKRFGTDF